MHQCWLNPLLMKRQNHENYLAQKERFNLLGTGSIKVDKIRPAFPLREDIKVSNQEFS